jgi:predicted transposase YdaD
MATPGGRRAVEQALYYLLQVLGRLPFEEFRVMIVEQIPQTEQIMKTMAEELEERGEARGLTRGRAEGRAETLKKQMMLKFGALAPEHAARIASATEQQLDLYIERILTATTPDAVFEPT